VRELNSASLHFDQAVIKKRSV